MRNKSVLLACVRTSLLLLLSAAAGLCQDGAAIYQARCAGCHDLPQGRVPPFTALKAMTPVKILESLDSGPMKQQAAGLTGSERYALVTYLATPALPPSASPPSSAFCPAQPKPTSNDAPTSLWNTWGANLANTRFQTAVASLKRDTIPNLKLKWAFGLGDGTAVRSQVAASDGGVFVADLSGDVDSLDSRSGCIRWTFNAETTVRTAIAVGENARGQPAVYFADQHANAYALDAATGRLLWKAHIAGHFASILTGGPQLYRGLLYFPVSSYEEVLAGSPKYECCTFRGSVVALDAATGKCIWQTYTISGPPQPTAKSSTGVQLYGPSGAAVWSTPTVDEKLNALYIATGDNYSDPPSASSDAVLALDARTGKLLWSKQLTAGDVYNVGPHGSGNDFDFGQPPILVSLSNGRRALVLGQKSGVAHALDPDRQGEILWQTRVGRGGKLGGIQWGSAADAENMYVAVSDLSMKALPDTTSPQGFRLELDPNAGGGLAALRLTNGEKLWTAKSAGCGDRKHCSPAQSAAVSGIPGVVFSGSLDGHLRAYATNTGEVIWDADTARDYDTVNGQKARGGSLDAAGPVIADGMLYVNSGYGQWGGMPGNVLLAFSPDGK